MLRKKKYGVGISISKETLKEILGVPQDVDMDIILNEFRDSVMIKFRNYQYISGELPTPKPVTFRLHLGEISGNITLREMSEGQEYLIQQYP